MQGGIESQIPKPSTEDSKSSLVERFPRGGWAKLENAPELQIYGWYLTPSDRATLLWAKPEHLQYRRPHGIRRMYFRDPRTSPRASDRDVLLAHRADVT